jgi:hypothetical protein
VVLFHRYEKNSLLDLNYFSKTKNTYLYVPKLNNKNYIVNIQMNLLDLQRTNVKIVVLQICIYKKNITVLAQILSFMLILASFFSQPKNTFCSGTDLVVLKKSILLNSIIYFIITEYN